MIHAQRLVLTLLCWLVAGAAGWWWHRPADPAPTAATAEAPAVTAPAPIETLSPQEQASRIAAVDAMALRNVSVPPGAAPSAMPSSGDIIWRLAALVVRDGERYSVWTASGQPSLRLRVGENLPDGDQIKAIHVDRIDVKSPRGRLRTLHLIEP